jgi:hypothetical protein
MACDQVFARATSGEEKVATIPVAARAENLGEEIFAIAKR